MKSAVSSASCLLSTLPRPLTFLSGKFPVDFTISRMRTDWRSVSTSAARSSHLHPSCRSGHQRRTTAPYPSGVAVGTRQEIPQLGFLPPRPLHHPSHRQCLTSQLRIIPFRNIKHESYPRQCPYPFCLNDFPHRSLILHQYPCQCSCLQGKSRQHLCHYCFLWNDRSRWPYKKISVCLLLGSLQSRQPLHPLPTWISGRALWSHHLRQVILSCPT